MTQNRSLASAPFAATVRALTLAAAVPLLLAGISRAAPPIGKSGECPPLTRSSVYEGVSLGTLFSGISNWQGRPPQAMIDAGQIQNPLSPDSSVNCVQVPPGLKPQVIASERTPGPLPAAGYLMYFTFDEKGRMWAVDNRDYPYVHTGSSPATYSTNRATGGTGRILIYEDADGDGSLDGYKVFYSGLMGPTSLEYVPWNGSGSAGVIVTVPPYVYFIPKSASNPDTADALQVVVSGLGSASSSYDTHGQPNSLTAGIDNFYYGHNGYNACGSPVVGQNRGVPCAEGNIWRFKALAIGSDTNTFQIHSADGPFNAHGIGQMEDGQWFKSGATGTPHSNHQIRHNYSTVSLTNDAEYGNEYWPLTNDRWLWEGSTTERAPGIGSPPGDFFTTSSAASGHDFYTARLLPRKYWNRFAFVCEGASKLCNQDSLTVHGSTWRLHRMNGKARSNIFASTDAWTAPLKVRTGPDGALWVLDWYNYLFLHNPASPRTMVAWHNPLRAKSRARIYRIVPENGATDPVLNLSQAGTGQLLQTLGHPNLHWRLMAQRLLLARVPSALERAALLDSLHRILTTDTTVEDTALGTSPRVLHALWTLTGIPKAHTFGAAPARWDSVMKGLLLHPAWTVRRNALLALPLTVASANAIKATCAVNDPHPHVRVQALDLFARSGATLADTLRAYFPMPAPSDGPIVSISGLRDDWAGEAFGTASYTGKVVNQAGTARPAGCPAIPGSTTALARPARAFTARNDLRFERRPDGFVLANKMQLASGELRVRDLRGETVFRSTYNASTGVWSAPAARGLRLPVYFYEFRENGGARLQGRIVLDPAL